MAAADRFELELCSFKHRGFSALYDRRALNFKRLPPLGVYILPHEYCTVQPVASQDLRFAVSPYKIYVDFDLELIWRLRIEILRFNLKLVSLRAPFAVLAR